jgi:hypothetical protein
MSIYSHGLEKIYSMETIDPKTIRKMELHTLAFDRKEIKEESFPEELDLGPGFRGWVRPFVLDEPIQILRLDQKTVSQLTAVQIVKIGDLLSESQLLIQLGRAKAEMIKSKLSSYLEGKEKRKSSKIDFLSLIKRHFAVFDLKKSYAFLSSYGLQSWITFTPSEIREITQLPPRTLKAWEEELLGQLPSCCSGWEVIKKEWVVPWMRQRGGFATPLEVEQFLRLKAFEGRESQKALQLWLKLFHLKNYFMTREGIVAADESHFALLERFFELIEGYFPSGQACYSLESIIAYIQREFAYHWVNMKPEVLERLFRLSPMLSVNSRREVRLAPKPSSQALPTCQNPLQTISRAQGTPL